MLIILLDEWGGSTYFKMILLQVFKEFLRLLLHESPLTQRDAVQRHDHFEMLWLRVECFTNSVNCWTPIRGKKNESSSTSAILTYRIKLESVVNVLACCEELYIF
jgi:hypothetical protein